MRRRLLWRTKNDETLDHEENDERVFDGEEDVHVALDVVAHEKQHAQ